jgi:hypothetical protein
VIVSGQDSDNKPKRSGRVRHDASGRAIWEWAVDSGRHAIDSTSRLLQKLDLTSLRVLGDDEKSWEKRGEAGKPAAPESPNAPREPAEPIPTFGGTPEADPMAGKRQGFNPYDTRTPTGRGIAHAPKPAAPARPRITQPVRPAKKPGLLARLFGRGAK